MKSKMKSAFAIIAVALMVMVAVVPMVSVFTGDSDAATIIVDPAEGTITIKATVYTDATTKAGAVPVKVTWGPSGEYSDTQNTATGLATFVISEDKMSNVTLQVMKTEDATKADPNYAPKVLGSLVSTNVYTTDILPGYKESATLTFNAKNVGTVYSYIGKEAIVKYTLYSKEDKSATVSGNGSVVKLNASSQFKVTYPLDSTNIWMEITGLEVDGKSIPFTSALTKILGDGATATIAAEQNVVTINAPASSANKIPNGAISAVSGKYTLETVETPISPSDFFIIKDKLVGGGSAYVMTKVAMPEKLTFTLGYGSSVSEVFTDVAVASNSLTVAPTGYYGTYKMGTISAVDGYNLTIEMVEYGEGEAVTKTPFNVYVADGCFYAVAPTGFIRGTSLVNMTTENFTIAQVTTSEGKVTYKPSAANTDIAVSGGVLVNGTVTNAPAGTNISVTGYSAEFGLKNGNAVTFTNSGIKYAFYVKAGDTITFGAPSGATLTTDSVGPFYIPADTAKNLVFDDKKLFFVFTDSDDEKIAVKVDATQYVNVNYTIPGADPVVGVAGTVEGNKITVSLTNGVVDTSTIKVYFTNANGAKNSFAAGSAATAVLYSESNGSMAVQTLDKTYTVVVKDSTGVVIEPATLKYDVYDAYYTETGSKIYTGTGIAVEDGKFRMNKNYVGVELKSTVQKVGCLVVADASYIFGDIYTLKTATDGSIVVNGNNIIVTAYGDSLTAKLTRNDGITPISGIKVEIGTGAFTPVGEATYTQNDGSFTVYSNTKIVAQKLRFGNEQATGYDFTTLQSAVVDDEKVTLFMPDKDAYEVAFVDADGDEIALAGNVTISGATTVSYADNVEKVQAKYTAETGTISITAGTPALRSFGVHTLTVAEIASGTITMVSDQSKCTFTVLGDDDEPVVGATVSLKKYVGDQPIQSGDLDVTDADGKTAVLLPVAGDSLETDYGYKVAAIGGYLFSDAVTKISGLSVTVKSISATISIALQNEAGKALSKNTTVDIYDGDDLYKDDYDVVSGKFSFVGSTEKTYTYTVAAINGEAATKGTYTFEEKMEAVGGVLKANEQEVYGDITDAAGVSIGVAGTTTVTAYDKDGEIVGGPAKYAEDGGNYYVIITSVENTDYYKVTTAIAGYTTSGKYKTTDIALPEETVLFTAKSANGYDLPAATFAAIKAFNADGKAIGTATIGGIIVAVDKVAYYESTVTSNTEGYTFNAKDTSIDGVFIAKESLIKGTVPATKDIDPAAQDVRLDLYLGESLVGSITEVDVNGTNYEAKVDLSGFVIGTAGFTFDSIVAVYSENGVVIASSPIDPYTPINNIVSPTQVKYVAVLIAPSALIEKHVNGEQVGNTATVTADASFIVAADEGTYTDGQYIYRFVGWYVDNKQVSTAAVYTFTMTEDVVISPQYDVVYEKLSDVNDVETPAEQGIDTNVLIIGICAVIVALIAVVYAVIKKE